MKIFEAPKQEQVQVSDKQGNPVILNINMLMTTAEADEMMDKNRLVDQAVACFGGKVEDYMEIPVAPLMKAVQYTIKALRNPDEATEIKQG